MKILTNILRWKLISFKEVWRFEQQLHIYWWWQHGVVKTPDFLIANFIWNIFCWEYSGPEFLEWTVVGQMLKNKLGQLKETRKIPNSRIVGFLTCCFLQIAFMHAWHVAYRSSFKELTPISLYPPPLPLPEFGHLKKQSTWNVTYINLWALYASTSV